jgi:tetratricopeptide (TPR) repeat protein
MGETPLNGKPGNIDGVRMDGTWLDDGIALYRVGKYEEAMLCFEKILEIYPDYPQFHFYVAAMLRKLGRQREREEYFKSPKVTEGFRRLAAQSSNEGDALTKVGKHDEARTYYAVSNLYKEAIKNPEFLNESWVEDLEEEFLGNIVSLSNTMEEDLEQRQKPPEEMDAVVIEIINKGVELADNGKYDEAIEYYDRALEIAPDTPLILLNKAISLCNKGNNLVKSKRPNDALECFDRAIAIKPDVTYGWNGKGSALIEMGKYDEAITSFDRALTIDPNLGSLWYKKGLALEKSGNADGAVKCYEKSLSVEPNSDYSASVKERLKYISNKTNYSASLKEQLKTISKKTKKWRLFR